MERRIAQPMVTRSDVRRALADCGGDLRAVGEKLGLDTQDLLMILAYDVTITTTRAKGEQTASGVFDAIDAEPE